MNSCQFVEAGGGLGLGVLLLFKTVQHESVLMIFSLFLNVFVIFFSFFGPLCPSFFMKR